MYAVTRPDGKIFPPLRQRLAKTLRALAGAGLLTAIHLMAAGAPAWAQTTVGPESKLPLPRFVSLKASPVNLREGPSKDHRTRWVFQRAGVPVEIVAEFENWRRIRDAEGADGWVYHSLLSGRRTALVTPWDKTEGKTLPLLERADERSRPVALLQPGVIVGAKQCTGTWCRLTVVLPGGTAAEGFMRQELLWGVYPDEKIE